MERTIKILMLGWELPPYHSGGLGRACEGMTKSLARRGVAVSFVLPKKFSDVKYDWMQVCDASEHTLSSLQENVSEEECLKMVQEHQCALSRGYFVHSQSTEVVCRACFSLIQSHELSHVGLYARGVKEIASQQKFEAIHAHDWMTFPAAALARAVAAQRGERVPFIAHVHATEIDRHDGPRIYGIEKWGMQAADKIITVSNYTKSVIVQHYGINPDKVSVIYNGIEPRPIERYPTHPLKDRHKLVLFLGRVTYQKGPDYYVRLAKKVTDQYPDVKFLMVGSGDMQSSVIEMAACEGLTGKLLFSSRISEEMMDPTYQMADVFVMPSVSEPFGIVPLEAIQNGTPAIVSKNSGIAEVVQNCIAVDFWDIDKMADSIVLLLKDENYARNLVALAQEEIKTLTWDLAANGLINIYNETVKGAVYA